MVNRSAKMGKSVFCGSQKEFKIVCRTEKSAYANPTAIVLYLQEFHTPVFHSDPNGSCARIEAVFEKFLECRSRSVNDLVRN